MTEIELTVPEPASKTPKLGVGVDADKDRVLVSVQLKQGDHVTVLYSNRHPANRETMGFIPLEIALPVAETEVALPAEPTDEMIRAFLAVEWPATHREYLRHPDDGPNSAADTERRIALAKRQYAALIKAAPKRNTGLE
jgi:hypothetical protein